MNLTVKTISPILLTVIFTVGILLAGALSKKMNLTISSNNYINGQLNYQILLLALTGLSLLTTFLLNKENFSNYFSFGQISAVGQELKFFGIKQGDNWMKTGLSLCIVISGITAIFMYFQLKQANPDWLTLRSGLLWIILFSLTNSFGE